jgi:hypothetical protein
MLIYTCLPAELKQQVAAESSLSTELLLQLEHAQREGPAAQQLARLKNELAEREEEQLCQRCRCAAAAAACCRNVSLNSMAYWYALFVIVVQ